MQKIHSGHWKSWGMRVEHMEKEAFKLFKPVHQLKSPECRLALKNQCIWFFPHRVWEGGRLSQCMSLVDNKHMGQNNRERQVLVEPISAAVTDKAMRVMSSLRASAPCRKEEGRNTAPETWRRAHGDRKESLQAQDWSWAQRVVLLCWGEGRGHSRPGHSVDKWIRLQMIAYPAPSVSVLENHIFKLRRVDIW